MENTGGYEPGQPVNPGQPGPTVNIPIMQQPVIVNGASQLVGMVPAWANVYVFASASFTAGTTVECSISGFIIPDSGGTVKVTAPSTDYGKYHAAVW